MTQQEALAQAILAALPEGDYGPLHIRPEEDGTWTVTSPLFPGFVAAGESLDEALTMAVDALTAWTEAKYEVEREQGEQQERERLQPLLDAVWSWHRAEKHQRTLDATTDDAAWNDAIVLTVDALNILRDTLDSMSDPDEADR